MALGAPVVILGDIEGLEDCLHTGAVCAVWVGKVASGVYLVRTHLTEQLDDDVDILRGEGTLLDAARLVKWQVEEVGVGVGVETEGAHRSTRLGTTDGTLDIEEFTRLGLTTLLGSDDIAHLAKGVAKAQLLRRIDILEHHIVVNGNITRCLVCHMHIVTLIHEADEGTTHRDNIVVGVRREDNHTLRVWQRWRRARRVVDIRLTTGPTRNGMLQVVEYADVNLVVRATLLKELTERILDVVLVCELKDRLIHDATKPHHSPAHELRCPIARSYEPRR